MGLHLFLPSAPEETVTMLPTFLLMNLLSLAGDVALQQLVHLEQAVSGELGRRRVLREEQEQRAKGPKEKVNMWLGASPRFPRPQLRTLHFIDLRFCTSKTCTFADPRGKVSVSKDGPVCPYSPSKGP